MSLNLPKLTRATAQHGRIVRVVVAAVAGSAPREPGAAMLVWEGGQSGTIGGGALELEACKRARAMLRDGRALRVEQLPLGPSLGQCCGGTVKLVSEVFDAASVARLAGQTTFARPLTGAGPMPDIVAALAAQGPTRPAVTHGWFLEPIGVQGAPLWIYGAGHVGRALVDVLSPLPDFRITWVDTAAGRFPDSIPGGVTALPATRPENAVALAPRDAHHLILTYSHALDLALCHAILAHGFASAGLIGSKTKWARFRARLQALGHAPGEISRITCPIGTPELGKHPQAIAVSTAGALLHIVLQTDSNGESRLDGRNGDQLRAVDT